MQQRTSSSKRVHHQNVDESGEVEKADIVKGFEYAKDKYIEIAPDELKALRIPTATTMQIKQFVKADEFSSALYDRPYFVTPRDEVQAKALSILRKALVQTGYRGSGEIAFESLTEKIETGSPAGRLVFPVFAALAEFERNLIRERTVAGLKAARARGRTGGRPAKLSPKEVKTIRALHKNADMPVAEIAARFGIARSILYRSVLGKPTKRYTPDEQAI